MKRAPITDFTFHPDYTNQSAVYCLNAWGAPCLSTEHNEVFYDWESAEAFATDFDRAFAVPRPLKRGDIA